MNDGLNDVSFFGFCFRQILFPESERREKFVSQNNNTSALQTDIMSSEEKDTSRGFTIDLSKNPIDHDSQIRHCSYSYFIDPTPSSENTTQHAYRSHPYHNAHGRGHQILNAYGGAPYSRSFESNGMAANATVPFVAYSYPPPGYYYPWGPQPPPVEYIHNIKKDDVLSGRGGATNAHSGNRAFRSLVRSYQGQYLKAKKRDKPAVASIIVDKIRANGGRFLRRAGDTTPQGQVLWVDIGDDRAREKTCQALREGAPELRRKRKVTPMDEDDIKRSEHENPNEAILSSSSSMDHTASIEEDGRNGKIGKTSSMVKKAMYTDARVSGDQDLQKKEPLMIRPSLSIVRRSQIHAVSVDQLNARDREVYLRDFLPPNPAIRRKSTKNQVSQASVTTFETSKADENVNSWQIVQI